MNRKYVDILLSVRVYAAEWLSPLGPRWISVLTGLPLAAWLIARGPIYNKNIPYWTRSYVVARIERVESPIRMSGQGSAATHKLVFRIHGKELAFPVSFLATAGDCVAVNYVNDFKGHPLVISVSPLTR